MDRRDQKARPVRVKRVVSRPIWRVPDRGYVTPRLREEERRTQAIGFRAHVGGRWPDESDD